MNAKSVFCFSETLRALYLGDNDFEYLPPDIKNLKNLQIVSTLFVQVWIILEPFVF